MTYHPHIGQEQLPMECSNGNVIFDETEQELTDLPTQIPQDRLWPIIDDVSAQCRSCRKQLFEIMSDSVDMNDLCPEQAEYLLGLVDKSRYLWDLADQLSKIMVEAFIDDSRKSVLSD
jgi:hypothetical protein